MGHALVVEDDDDAAQAMAALISREGHSVVTASTVAQAQRLLAMRKPGLVLLDLGLPDGSGLRLLDDTQLLGDAEVVLITGQASLETSIQGLRLGAADYLVKPVSPQHLRSLLARLMPPSQLRAQLAEVETTWRETGRFGPLVGASEVMQDVYQQIARVAGTAVTVFVQGESGTGKELVARAVHDLSRRREQPFLAVNCAALSPHLIESELFGHERGSFTGAERVHQGFFERAHGGTLFLDEVTEMPMDLQAKLLRVLETGTFLRVGSTETRQTDVRIIAATNRDAAQAMAHKALREDLFYRLNVFPIALPPLRERGSDIDLLAARFLQDLNRQEGGRKTLSPVACARLRSWAWPGNVRELKNTLQRAWVMASNDVIDAQWLPGATGAATAALQLPAAPALRAQDPAADGELVELGGIHPPQVRISLGTPLAQAERDLVLATYTHFGQHRERTAA
ncbi:MAG: sigma-54-dependent Fis family transcriptional regulator [Comamonadaceae bacterium]|nr:MAG: sigma-54-dependent Fis family transcriptional regulator [Comamonadaceae bacterium]